MAPVKQAGSRWGIVLIATAFNLLFEYAVRGIPDLLAHPLLFPVLSAAYFTYFSMVQDLVVRFRLRDMHLMGVAFFAGTVYVFLASGLALTPPLVLGINPLAILFTNLVWWGALQTLLARYVAIRLMRHGESQVLLSPAGWGVALAVQAGVLLLFQLSGRVPAMTPVAVGVLILLLMASAATVKITLPPREVPVPGTRPDPVWDLLGGASVVLFLACILFLTGETAWMGPFAVDRTALQVVVLWSLLVAAVIALHRLVRITAGRRGVDPLNP
ncbi:MAG: hypothetical protein LUO87_00460 [Methanomicrobiales archaeon]|nr:hypothetical protein [Methanomicrobiales archaeon]MDD1660483.1 hypothetical protein [Methanomicrobiales archaeon]